MGYFGLRQTFSHNLEQVSLVKMSDIIYIWLTNTTPWVIKEVPQCWFINQYIKYEDL